MSSSQTKRSASTRKAYDEVDGGSQFAISLKASKSNHDLRLDDHNGDPRRNRNWDLENNDSSIKLLNRVNNKVDKMTSQPPTKI